MKMSIRVKVIQKAKNILRIELVKLLASLSAEQKKIQSAIIHEKLFALPEFQNSQRISCYCSTMNEVDTKSIVERIFHLNKQLYVPRYSYRFKKMFMERVKDLPDYEAILERKRAVRPMPKYSDNREDAMDVGGLNLIIVNGLAFTMTGKRLGTGGGYYDTYIRNHRKAGFKKFTTIGLAFKEQVFPYLPIHCYDVNLDFVLCPYK